MKMSIAVQTLIFLKAILMGVMLGILYDLLRALRRDLGAGVAFTALCDTVFWIGTLGAIFVFVLTAAEGEGRFYVLLGAAMGAILYFIALSPPILAIFMSMVGVVIKSLNFLVEMLNKLKDIGKSAKKKAEHRKQSDKTLKKPFHFHRKGFKMK